MILVDTNVWSEAFRKRPDDRVQRWAEANAERLWLATVVIGELLSGAALLDEGSRKTALLASFDRLIAERADRIAAFDLEAARHYGPILAHQVRAGRSPGTADSQIAAIARSRDLTLATRNVKHFEGLGLELVNPWIP